MQITDKQYDLIQKFMRNELNESEQALFNESLTNPDFKNELEDQARILNAIETSKDQELRSFLNNIEVPLSENPNTQVAEKNIELKSNKVPGVLKYAILLALLLGAIFMVKKNLDTTAQPDLFAEYYETPMALNGRGVTQDDAIFRKAIVDYQEGRYAESNAQLSALADDNNEALYYASISKIEIGQYKDAIVGFKKLKLKNSKYNSDADWFIALIHLKMNQVEDCKNQLDIIISESNHPYKMKAQKLLSKL